MASYTRENEDDGEYRDEFSGYTCEDKKYSQDRRETPSEKRTKPLEIVRTAGSDDSASDQSDSLPPTYELMQLINHIKFTGNIVRNVFTFYDFAAIGSAPIARGGYFQTRRLPGIGVAKYPVLPTTDTVLSAKSYRALARELCVLSHAPLMKHENIVNLRAISWTRLDPVRQSWIPVAFLELAELGTLTQYLAGRSIGVDINIEIAQDIGRGLQALHACGITHGDLKSDNILVFERSEGEVRAKLSDFGCSIFAGDEDQAEADGMVELTTGTEPWNSPELGQRVARPLLPKTDTYSFGLLVWQLFLDGRSPFEGQEGDDINLRKRQDMMISDASVSLEEQYNMKMLLRGQAASSDRFQLYMRSVSIPKRCFRYTLSLAIQNRNLDKALEAFARDSYYGTADHSHSPTVGAQIRSGTVTSVSFLRLFDTPKSVKEMFYQGLHDVAEDESLSPKVRAEAHLQLCYANIDAFGTAQNITAAVESIGNAASFGNHTAGALLPRIYKAAGAELNPSLQDASRQWLAAAVDSGSLLARHELRSLDRRLLQKSEERLRLEYGALSEGGNKFSVEDIEIFFLPANTEVIKVLLGGRRGIQAPGDPQVIASFLSRFKNTFIHAGAAVGVDPDQFRTVLSIAGTHYLDIQDEAGNTPLILALRFANASIARILLQQGASPSLGNKSGETPWHWLVSVEEQSDINSVIELLSHDKDGLTAFAEPVFSTSNQYYISHGGTPLHWAVQMGAPGLASALVHCGADPLYDYHGVRPLDLAIQHNVPDLVRLFLDTLHSQGRTFTPGSSILMNGEDGMDLKEISKDPLFLQATALLPLHERLIYRGPSWLDDMRLTLRILHEHGCLAHFGKMDSKLKLDMARVVAISSSFGCEVLEMLDSESVFSHNSGNGDDNAAGGALTEVDFWNGLLEKILPVALPAIIHYTIARAKACSPSGRLRKPEQLLLQCCTALNADVSVVEAIVQDGVNIDCVDEMGRTALMIAVCNRNFEIASCLIGHGADINATWVNEKHAVNILFEYLITNLDIAFIPLKYLLDPLHPFSDKIPSFVVMPEQNTTALHLACSDGNPVIVDYLLSKFDIQEFLDYRDPDGWTALHFAVYYGHVDIAMKLCRKGADVNARAGNCTMQNHTCASPVDFCYRWAAPSTKVLAAKYGLERTREDVYLGRLRIFDHLVRRYKARRARWRPVHASLAHKTAVGAAEDGMTRVLAEALRRLKREDREAAGRPAIYPAELDALLVLAVKHGHVGATRLLLGHGADPNQRLRNGVSLLHVAAWQHKAELVYVLARTGGLDVNAEDDEGETPGSYALRAQDLATIRVLKSQGGLFALPRERMAAVLGNSGLDVARLPSNFKLHFDVRVAGEPSDEESSGPEDKDEKPS